MQSGLNFRSLRRLKVLSGEPKSLRLLCAVWSQIPVFAQVVNIVVTTEKAMPVLCSLVGVSPVCAGCCYCRENRKAALALYSLVGFSPVCAGCCYCQEYRKGCARFVQSGRIFPSLRGLLLLSGVPKRLRLLCTVWSDFP